MLRPVIDLPALTARLWRPLGRAGLAAGILLAATGLARAEAGEVRLMRHFDLADLPLLVVEQRKLIEKQAEIMGLGAVTVRWAEPGKSGEGEALGSGQTDIASIDLAAFAAAWDEKTGSPQEIRALASLEQMPYVLVSRSAAVHTIRDFTDKDRIALPAQRNGTAALMLEMAAAQEWGPEHYNKLDRLTVARPDAEAAAALVSGKGDLTAHFSRIPYVDDELANPSVHRVMDSFDVAGPHSGSVLALTKRFHDANPMLCSAILSGLEEAQDLIKNNPGEAAEIYGGIVKGQGVAVEDLTDMIGDPDIHFTTTPAGVRHLVEFMRKIGRIKHQPGSWQDLFFSEAHNLPGG